jgi:hypothetical protein
VATCTLTSGRILKDGAFVEAGGSVSLSDADAARIRESGCVLELAPPAPDAPAAPVAEPEAPPAKPKRRRSSAKVRAPADPAPEAPDETGED